MHPSTGIFKYKHFTYEIKEKISDIYNLLRVYYYTKEEEYSIIEYEFISNSFLRSIHREIRSHSYLHISYLSISLEYL